MKGMKKVILAAIIVPLTLGSISVFANGGPGKGGHQRWGEQGGCDSVNPQAMMRVLELTPEQANKIQAIRENGRKQMLADRQSRQESRSQFRQKMQKIEMAEKFDENAARALAKEMFELKTEKREQARMDRQVQRMRIHHDIRKVLNPEQQKKWEVMLELKPFDHCKSRQGKGFEKGRFGGSRGFDGDGRPFGYRQ